MAASTQPLVSVVIPVYNGQRFLRQALKSVFDQTCRPLEVLVIDDGSTDASAEIVRGFDGVRYIQQGNAGAAAARNAGIAASRGELIGLLDQDDEWLPDKLARQTTVLAANPEVGLVLGHSRQFLEPGEPMPAWILKAELGDQPGYISSVWLMRRTAWDAVGPFDARYRIAQDVDWLARAKDVGVGIHMLPEVVIRRRIHGGNLSAEAATARQDLVTLLRHSVHRQERSTRG